MISGHDSHWETTVPGKLPGSPEVLAATTGNGVPLAVGVPIVVVVLVLLVVVQLRRKRQGRDRDS
jgi:hypothetical protein